MPRPVLLACGLLAMVLLSAQTRERPAVRVDNYSVLVDVVVTDKHNRHVTDLNAEDFLIFEDGEPQELGTFQVISGRAEPTAPQTAIRTDEGMPAQSADSPRLIILLLDYATVEYLNQGYVPGRLEPISRTALFATLPPRLEASSSATPTTSFPR